MGRWGRGRYFFGLEVVEEEVEEEEEEDSLDLTLSRKPILIVLLIGIDGFWLFGCFG